MLIRIAVQFGGRTVDKNDIPVIGEFQDTADVVGMLGGISASPGLAVII